jgi:hypothetical protein
MRHHLHVVSVALGLVLGLASLALAENEPKVHDAGFFLRLSAGFGAASNTNEDVDLFGAGPEKLELSGGGSDVNFAIGGIVRRNLAIHGTIWGWSIDANPKYAGESLDLLANTTAMLFAYGGGVTYYLEPSNFYFSASVGAAEIDLEIGDVTASTDFGWATQGMVGKEGGGQEVGAGRGLRRGLRLGSGSGRHDLQRLELGRAVLRHV